MTVKSLEELANDALYAISDLYDEDEFEDLQQLPAIEQIKKRYLHADCDDFALALHVLTGWDIVAVNCASKGPLHRLNRDDQGRLIDITGVVTEDDLRKRYKARKLSLDSAGATMSMIDDDERLKDVITVFALLPYPPFTQIAASGQKFVVSGAHFDDDLGNQSGPSP